MKLKKDKLQKQAALQLCRVLEYCIDILTLFDDWRPTATPEAQAGAKQAIIFVRRELQKINNDNCYEEHRERSHSRQKAYEYHFEEVRAALEQERFTNACNHLMNLLHDHSGENNTDIGAILNLLSEVKGYCPLVAPQRPRGAI